ncbi:MAG: hypothetical protein KAS32_25530 [Candidatus Peribacteraceae bacterium]|nr:hypothetical protein [Candidatus Peribacteraceae bacterium]
MSGGHWNYDQHFMESFLYSVGRDSDVMLRFPKLAQTLRELSPVLGQIAHDLDWDMSGDSEIKDDKTFELKALEEITKVLDMKGKK